LVLRVLVDPSRQNNFGKGGLGNDAVSISVQDPSGTNNAGMSTLPDGQTSFIVSP